MADRIVDGIVVPDDEGKIIVPQGFNDAGITREHFAKKGENILTCNLFVLEPLKKIGETVTCSQCGEKFKVVLQGDTEK